MKKILVTIIFMHVLTISSISAELNDCTIINKLNPKYLACKAANFAKNSANYQKKWSNVAVSTKKINNN
jgi:hypothetical protein|tara:strand:- start:4788 stop:4994 length:207 start_codon:yes stop_codon:yes gene_type:complete